MSRFQYYTMKNLIRFFLEQGKEGDCWDFKQEWHENIADLIKDIICFANTVHDENCYLIFGVSDDLSVTGMKKARRKQADIIDTISTLTFAGDAYPAIDVKTVVYYDVKKGTVESGSTSRIAMWMLDTDYDGMCIEPDMVFFPMGGKKDGWNKLAKTLKTEINMDLIDKYAGNESLWFTAQPNTAIAVKIIDDRGIESLKVIRIGDE